MLLMVSGFATGDGPGGPSHVAGDGPGGPFYVGGDGPGGPSYLGVAAIRERSRQLVARPPYVPVADRQRN